MWLNFLIKGHGKLCVHSSWQVSLVISLSETFLGTTALPAVTVFDKEKTSIKHNLTNRKKKYMHFCQWIALHIGENVTMRFLMHTHILKIRQE